LDGEFTKYCRLKPCYWDPQKANPTKSCLDVCGDKIAIAGSDSNNRGSIWFTTKDNLDALSCISGHSALILCIKIWKDKLISGSHDNKVKVWDMSTLECEVTYSGHMGPIWSLDISLEKPIIASASGDLSIKLWSIPNAETIHTLTGHTKQLACVKIQSELIISGSYDKTIRIWSMENGNFLRVLSGHTGSVLCVGVLDQFILSGSADTTIRIWEISSGRCVLTVNAHSESILSLDVNSLSNILTCSKDGTGKLWTLQTIK